MNSSAMVRICSLVALCSLLSSQMASTHSTVSHSQQQRSAQQQTEEEEEQHSAQQPIPVEHSSQKSKKMSGWVQTYKEPKAVPSEAVGSDKQQQREEREEAEEAEEEEEMSCTIKVQKVEKHKGKCIRLRGGSMACQTNTYLDPVNADCMYVD